MTESSEGWAIDLDVESVRKVEEARRSRRLLCAVMIRSSGKPGPAKRQASYVFVDSVEMWNVLSKEKAERICRARPTVLPPAHAFQKEGVKTSADSAP